VFSAPEKPELGHRHLELLLQRRVDGLFCHGLAMPPDTAKAIIKEGTPIVLFNAWGWPDDVAADRVNLDVATACAQAIVHLYEQGCRTIYYLGNRKAAATDDQRKVGYAEGVRQLKEHSIDGITTGLLDVGDKDCLSQLQRAIDQDSPVGLLGFDDLNAFAYMSKLLELGYRIPEQVKIVGINNTNISRLSFPSMTSIQTPYKLQAEAAVQMMMTKLGNAGGEPEGTGTNKIVQIPLALIARKSTEQ
jgi:LacI family transcriptional regulator